MYFRPDIDWRFEHRDVPDKELISWSSWNEDSTNRNVAVLGALTFDWLIIIIDLIIYREEFMSACLQQGRDQYSYYCSAAKEVRAKWAII